MLYDYVELPDSTRVAHSEVLPDGRIKIRIERPTGRGFDSAYCHLPFREWEAASGFSLEELEKLERFLENNTPLIWDLAEEAGQQKQD